MISFTFVLFVYIITFINEWSDCQPTHRDVIVKLNETSQRLSDVFLQNTHMTSFSVQDSESVLESTVLFNRALRRRNADLESMLTSAQHLHDVTEQVLHVLINGQTELFADFDSGAVYFNSIIFKRNLAAAHNSLLQYYNDVISASGSDVINGPVLQRINEFYGNEFELLRSFSSFMRETLQRTRWLKKRVSLPLLRKENHKLCDFRLIQNFINEIYLYTSQTVLFESMGELLKVKRIENVQEKRLGKKFQKIMKSASKFAALVQAVREKCYSHMPHILDAEFHDLVTASMESALNNTDGDIRTQARRVRRLVKYHLQVRYYWINWSVSVRARSKPNFHEAPVQVLEMRNNFCDRYALPRRSLRSFNGNPFGFDSRKSSITRPGHFCVRATTTPQVGAHQLKSCELSCSEAGKCKTQKYTFDQYCSCNEGFFGDMCQTNTSDVISSLLNHIRI